MMMLIRTKELMKRLKGKPQMSCDCGFTFIIDGLQLRQRGRISINITMYIIYNGVAEIYGKYASLRRAFCLKVFSLNHALYIIMNL